MIKPLNELKRDNILKVFNASLVRRNTSRTIISEDTDLSYVTVDKMVNALIDANILKQTTTSKSAAVQRRSRMLSVKLYYWIGIYLLLPNKFTFYICDLSLRCLKSFSYTPDDTIFIDDEINAFLRKASSFATLSINVDHCCGTGVLVPGVYDKETDTVSLSAINHIGSLKFKELFTPYSFGNDPYILSVYSAFAGEIGKCSKEGQNSYCLFLGQNSILSSYVTPSQVCEIKSLGILRTAENKKLSKIVSNAPQPEDLFFDLCDHLFNLMNSIPIDVIHVCDTLYNNSKSVSSVMKSIMYYKFEFERIRIPEIVPYELSENSVRFISREIRDRWFSEKILADKG